MSDDRWDDFFIDEPEDDRADDLLEGPVIISPSRSSESDDAADEARAPVRPEPEAETPAPAASVPQEEAAELRQPVREPVPRPVEPQPSPSPAGPDTRTAQGEPGGRAHARTAAPRPFVAPTDVPPEASGPSRERRLAEVLDRFMRDAPDVQAAALVSLDGFTMASALPEGMQEDRVGAMSAAILGLGERAATELGRGELSQVFIEGDEGTVVLVSAGRRAVLTALARHGAKLGLLMYDLRATADRVGKILG